MNYFILLQIFMWKYLRINRGLVRIGERVLSDEVVSEIGGTGRVRIDIGQRSLYLHENALDDRFT